VSNSRLATFMVREHDTIRAEIVPAENGI
jgi:hypothetical protein